MMPATRLPGIGPDPVVEVLAAHHVWPHYIRTMRASLWRCTCGDEWPLSEYPEWQPVEDAHQADMLHRAGLVVA